MVGMIEVQLARCRERLEQFLVDLLEPVGRREQRHWGVGLCARPTVGGQAEIH